MRPGTKSQLFMAIFMLALIALVPLGVFSETDLPWRVTTLIGSVVIGCWVTTVALKKKNPSVILIFLLLWATAFVIGKALFFISLGGAASGSFGLLVWRFSSLPGRAEAKSTEARE